MSNDVLKELENVLNNPDIKDVCEILNDLNNKKLDENERRKKEIQVASMPKCEEIKEKLSTIKACSDSVYKDLIIQLVKKKEAAVLKYMLYGEEKLLESDHNEIFCMLGKSFECDKDGQDYDLCFKNYVEHILERFLDKEKDKDKDILCFAANSLSSKAVLALLNNQRATLGYKHDKKKIDSLCIGNLDPETIEEHFDSCIYEISEGKDKMILYDYTSIIPVLPSVLYKNRHKSDEKKAKKNEKATPLLEHEVVYYLSQNKEFKRLLAHPLISSFLYIKWQKMYGIFLANFIFYLMFCLTLMLYTTIFYIAKERQDTARLICIIILGMSTAMLGLRELYQMWVAGWVYFENFENYMEISLIAVISAMFFVNDPDEEIKQALCAVAVLLLAFKILFDLENIDSVSIYVAMFRRVSLNFFRCFPVYFIIIIAFAFCFYTFFDSLEDEDENKDEEVVKSVNIDKDPVTPLLYLFQTMIMLTGEFNSNDLNFDTLASRIVFLVFIFMVPIVLLNLINGIAVSDAQTIHDEAHLVRLANRAEYIRYCETVFKYYKAVQWIYHKLFGIKNSVFICLGYLPQDQKYLVINRDGFVLVSNGKLRYGSDDKKKPEGRRSLDYYNFINKRASKSKVKIDHGVVRETEMLLLNRRENRKQRDSEKKRKHELDILNEKLDALSISLQNIENQIKPKIKD